MSVFLNCCIDNLNSYVLPLLQLTVIVKKVLYLQWDVVCLCYVSERFEFVFVSYCSFSREKSVTFRFILFIIHAFYFEHFKIALFSYFFMSVTYYPLRIYDFNLNTMYTRLSCFHRSCYILYFTIVLWILVYDRKRMKDGKINFMLTRTLTLWRERCKIILSMKSDILHLPTLQTAFLVTYLFIYWMCYIRYYFQHFDIKIYILFNINNCQTRCNTKQSIYYSASSLYVFRVSTTPIIRSTQNCNYSPWYWPYWKEIAAQKLWPVPEAVVTVLCTPDDGCGWHPKHVEWTCRIINRLLCVASRWPIIYIDKRCTEP